ncbi:cell division regulator GpsB [Oceanobacillus luteolus]|uniref:Cell division regulator GpsB n=1 Tax=Oceanobacillus luteolus TaxID=1274358 RepID=A0ABW4HRQ2_9BACI|nr:cell division regulator GpsB [Oceanobacillus luteolus]MCM3738899.1 cell division regulator GpsB [Oceanobacillus luteolus]
MSFDQTQLNAKDIYEKDFKTEFRGYSQKEVDEFLDVIIQDYDAFQQEIQRLKQENERLKRTSEDHQHTRIRPPQQNTQVNYDVLKRLSNLEKAVFGKKVSSSTE